MARQLGMLGSSCILIELEWSRSWDWSDALRWARLCYVRWPLRLTGKDERIVTAVAGARRVEEEKQGRPVTASFVETSQSAAALPGCGDGVGVRRGGGREVGNGQDMGQCEGMVGMEWGQGEWGWGKGGVGCGEERVERGCGGCGCLCGCVGGGGGYRLRRSEVGCGGVRGRSGEITHLLKKFVLAADILVEQPHVLWSNADLPTAVALIALPLTGESNGHLQ